MDNTKPPFRPFPSAREQLELLWLLWTSAEIPHEMWGDVETTAIMAHTKKKPLTLEYIRDFFKWQPGRSEEIIARCDFSTDDECARIGELITTFDWLCREIAASSKVRVGESELRAFADRRRCGERVEGVESYSQYVARKDLRHVAEALASIDEVTTQWLWWRVREQSWFLRQTPKEEVRNCRKYMSVTKANTVAKKVAKRMGKAFFSLSERAQTNEIGCSATTWKKTPFYTTALQRGQITPPKPKGKKVVGFTEQFESVIGDGEKDGVLNEVAEKEERQQKENARQKELERLIADQNSDSAADKRQRLSKKGL